MIIPHTRVGEKVCPLMAIVKEMQDMTIPGAEYCFGQHCMLWRWINPDQNKGDDLGYCGLGGKPTTVP